jgi:adenylate cyclase
MTLSLDALADCFEGVTPSVISTVSDQGVPNVSYLSQVVRIDGLHVGLSNQFFGKTGANLRAVPRATILLVDGRSGEQYRLETLFIRSETSGAIFDRVSAHLTASGTQVGMTGVMQLRAVDIFQVAKISHIPSEPQAELDPPTPQSVDLADAATIAATVSDAAELGEVVDSLLDGLTRKLDCHGACLFLRDATRPVLTTIGSRGYGRSGIGSEVAFGDGVVGIAAESGQRVKVSDLSRVQRFSSAVQNAVQDERATKIIGLPGLDNAMGQLAVPILFQKRLIGVVLLESRNRMAFAPDAEDLIDLVSRLAGAAIAHCDIAASVAEQVAAVVPTAPLVQNAIKVVHHIYDDSVFVEDAYVIKGVAGRLLMLILERHLNEGRVDFTNRELRLSEDMRLPDFKDNLETRLLLLRRRLDEKQGPIHLLHVGRGQLRLELKGRPAIRHI